jgi:hypothetical protein
MNLLKNKSRQQSCSQKLQKVKIFRKSFNTGKEDLYNENYKALLKKLQRTLKNGNIYHAHDLEELTWLKCLYQPKYYKDSIQFP